MAARQPVGWPGDAPNHFYQGQAEPTGVWQRNVGFWPYRKDSKPKFRLRVTCVNPGAPPLTLHWFLRWENKSETDHDIPLSPMVKIEVREYIIGDRLLGFGGDTILGIYASDVGGSHPGEPRYDLGFHTLISFWAIRDEDIFTRLAVAIPSGLIGALITLALTK